MSELQAQCWICPECYDDSHHQPGDKYCRVQQRNSQLEQVIADMEQEDIDFMKANDCGAGMLLAMRDKAVAELQQLLKDTTTTTTLQQEGLLKLAEFGRQCFNALSEGGALDPWDLQEMAEEAGLVEAEQRNEPCADGDPDQCRCLEYEADFPATCYRVPDKYMPLLQGQLTRPEPPEVE